MQSTLTRRTGLTLISAGILLFLFAMYQLFGTALITKQAQAELTNDFTSVVEDVAANKNSQDTLDKLKTITITEITTETIESTETIQTEITASPFENLTAAELAEIEAIVYQPQGEAIAQIQAAEMNLDSIVVQGTSVSALRKGPGHYIDSTALCATGNAAIAGHRTTYGSPFGDIANLQYGDEIFVHTPYGSCTYTVTERFIVQPNETWVVKDQGDNRLTLTSCHPKYSAAQRYVVVAQLTESSAPYLPSQSEIDALIAATSETTITTEEITTTETIETETKVEVEVEIPCEDCEDIQASTQDQANTIGEGDGFGTGLDGSGNSELLAVILYGILFFATWFRSFKVANYFGETKGRKFKHAAYAIASIPIVVTLAFWFYRLDLFLPSY